MSVCDSLFHIKYCSDSFTTPFHYTLPTNPTILTSVAFLDCHSLRCLGLTRQEKGKQLRMLQATGRIGRTLFSSLKLSNSVIMVVLPCSSGAGVNI